MTPEEHKGKEFRHRMAKFIVTVNEVVSQFNFGGKIGRKDAYQCTLKSNPATSHSVYPVATFDNEFEPYVPTPPKPAPVVQETPATPVAETATATKE